VLNLSTRYVAARWPRNCVCPETVYDGYHYASDCPAANRPRHLDELVNAILDAAGAQAHAEYDPVVIARSVQAVKVAVAELESALDSLGGADG